MRLEMFAEEEKRRVEEEKVNDRPNKVKKSSSMIRLNVDKQDNAMPYCDDCKRRHPPNEHSSKFAKRNQNPDYQAHEGDIVDDIFCHAYLSLSDSDEWVVRTPNYRAPIAHFYLHFPLSIAARLHQLLLSRNFPMHYLLSIAY